MEMTKRMQQHFLDSLLYFIGGVFWENYRSFLQIKM